MNFAVVGLGHWAWSGGVEGRVHQDFLILRDNEVFGDSSHLLLSDTAGKELTTLIVADQFLDFL